MGWAVGFDERWQRDIGYGVPSICDFPNCCRTIDRGLSYVCGGEPYGGDVGCGLYFCEQHRNYTRRGKSVCYRCSRGKAPFTPKPDLQSWLNHKATAPSWAAWRAEQRPSETRR